MAVPIQWIDNHTVMGLLPTLYLGPVDTNFDTSAGGYFRSQRQQ